MSLSDVEPVSRRGVATRTRGKLLALGVATALVLYLCYQLATPFIPALAWAITLAVVTHGASQWVERRLASRSLKAAACTAAVAVAILLPVALVGYLAAEQVAGAVAELQSEETQQSLADWLHQYPRLERLWRSATRNYNPLEKAPELIERLQPGAVAAISTPIYIGLQLVLTLYALFFLYRDGQQALSATRRMLPLTDEETNRLLGALDDTLHATVYGTMTVAAIQAAAGGTMLWLLGVPGAILWTVAMALVAIVPTGTFTVWGPATVYLALQDEWLKAFILAGWGAFAVGVIDNFLYPVLVGKRLRQHTLVTFVSIIGGVSLFGMTGIVLGPVIVTITFFLLDTWRRRTEHGAAAERG